MNAASSCWIRRKPKQPPSGPSACRTPKSNHARGWTPARNCPTSLARPRCSRKRSPSKNRDSPYFPKLGTVPILSLLLAELEHRADHDANADRDREVVAVVVRAVDGGVETVDLRADAKVCRRHALGEPGEVFAAHRGLRQLVHV